jgi:hypothetical protein
LLGFYWFARRRLPALAGLAVVFLRALSPFRGAALEARSNSLPVGFLAFRMAEDATGKKMSRRYDENRAGDHICYYSDLWKMESHYPDWRIVKTLRMIFEEIAAGRKQRLPAGIL